MKEFTEMMQKNLPNPKKSNLEEWQLTSVSQQRQLLGNNIRESEHCLLTLPTHAITSFTVGEILEKIENELDLDIVGLTYEQSDKGPIMQTVWKGMNSYSKLKGFSNDLTANNEATEILSKFQFLANQSSDEKLFDFNEFPDVEK